MALVLVLCAAGILLSVAPAAAQVVVNEVLYDTPGTDAGTFTEIHGPGGTSLDNYELVGVNGSNGADYATINLSGNTIPADGYFVVAQDATVLNADLIDPTVDWQNGPDQVDLRLNGVTVDSLCYGDAGGTLTCEGTNAPDVFGGSSLTRDAMSTDTDDNSVDFIEDPTPTPGGPFDSAATCVEPSGLTCTSDCGTLDITLTWTNEDTYDTIDIVRDGVTIAGSLPGTTTTYTDSAVAAGPHTYDVQVVCTNGIAATASCTIVHCPGGPPDVSINEIRVDEPGTDNDEYFELTGAPGTSLDGVTYIVIGDGTGGSGVVEAVVDLTGQTIPASGHFVAAESTFTLGTADFVTSLNFENGDNVSHMLVYLFSGALNDDLDTNDDGVLDATPWSDIIDCVSLITSGPSNQIYCTTTVGPDGTFLPGHVKRCPDGSGGTWTIGTFDPDPMAGGSDTPGAPNFCPTCNPPTDLVCTSDCVTGDVTLTWTNQSTYTGITVVRDGTTVGTLGGSDTTFTDSALANGTYSYEVTGECSPGDTATGTCSVIVGVYNGETNIIWAAEGPGGDVDSAGALATALAANGQSVLVIGDLQNFSCIDQLDATNVVWSMLGTYPNRHGLSSAEGDVLVGLVTAGVGVYVESTDTWGFDAPTAFADYDGVQGTQADGTIMVDGDDSFTSMNGLSFGSIDESAQLNVPYTQDNGAGNDYTDQLIPTGTDPMIPADVYGNDAGLIWQNNPDGNPDPMVTEDPYGVAILYNTGSGHVLTQSWEFGGFGGDQTALAATYSAALAGTTGGGTTFIRGDANGDGAIQINDPIAILSYEFSGGSLICLDAADVNDDGALQINDPIALLAYQFSSGPPPASPFPSCGTDPTTGDTLDCAGPIPGCP